MKVLRFFKGVFKDILLNLFHIILFLITFSILIAISLIALFGFIWIICIIPDLISSYGYVNLAQIILILEVIIIGMWLNGINILNLPKSIWRYLKRKWNEID